MGKKIQVIVRGYCPEIQDSKEMPVTFAEVSLLGSSGPYYKQTAFSCEYAQENGCSVMNECPIFLNAKFQEH